MSPPYHARRAVVSATRRADRIPRLVLVGAGHAHLRVLESLAGDTWPPVDVTLVSPDARELYSGMVPGYLQGTYEAAELTLDVAAIAARAGARFVRAAAERIEVDGRRVLTGGSAEPFELVSVDVGSIPAGLERPGVRAHALSLRPMGRAVELRRWVDTESSRDGDEVRIVVVGAGAGGVEVALAVDARLRERDAVPRVTLVDRSSNILDTYEATARDRARSILADRGVRIMLEETAASVDEGGVELESGTRIEADAVVWTTGAAPPPLLGASDVPTDSGGWLRVSAHLRSVSGAPVWGAGDCVSIEGHDLPKAGVYAVREGPILAHNLRAALTDDEPRAYRPQSSFLSLLNTGDGKALLRWRGFAFHGRPAWWLKDRIDRRFVKRYATVAGDRSSTR